MTKEELTALKKQLHNAAPIPYQTVLQLIDQCLKYEELNAHEKTRVNDLLKIKELERKAELLVGALEYISKPTYGTELTDTDAERKDILWNHLKIFQNKAREAIKQYRSSGE